ncbi:acetylxylan esterase [Rhizobium sp. Root1220]|uniref:acetylxylan esterase n=1 Tax=Rhizobium sp. Root1220 TaxID=1736432 RepID=UPI0006FD0EC8|nr:acetylxylan esterase [Rhizobium sp. Root1220]KQV66248.1 deacetylase [Rhizobium sp. Root1220]
MSIPTTHPFAFDPTYGMKLGQLLAIVPPEAPPGFDDFWKKRYRRAIAIDPGPVLTRSRLHHPTWQVLDIVYTSTDGLRIGGWLLLPHDRPVRRGLVVGHGYGGREVPEFDLPVEETAILFLCSRGMSLSAHPPIPPDAPGHVLYDIDKPDDYVIGGCVDDVWLGVSTLLALYPWIAGRIGYIGASFGGGLGALAIPFDERIDRGHLIVPTFGDRKQWLSLPTVGSADSVQTYQKTHPDVLEHLRLYDAATAATRIMVPMLVAAALFDPAVAPPCQFAVANAVPASKDNEIFVLDAGHFDYPGMMEQNYALREKLRAFMRLL